MKSQKMAMSDKQVVVAAKSAVKECIHITHEDGCGTGCIHYVE
jgi:hypothetical protein